MGDRKWKAICASEKGAGTPQMWHVLSFCGQFDQKFFDNLPGPPPEVGELTEEQRQNKRLAVEARAKRRLAIKYARVRDRISTGGATQPAALTRKHLDLLKQYDS